METKKMSLANIQGKLSRTEMKKIMAGSDGWNGACGPSCSAQGPTCQCYSVTGTYNNEYRCHCS